MWLRFAWLPFARLPWARLVRVLAPVIVLAGLAGSLPAQAQDDSIAEDLDEQLATDETIVGSRNEQAGLVDAQQDLATTIDALGANLASIEARLEMLEGDVVQQQQLVEVITAERAAIELERDRVSLNITETEARVTQLAHELTQRAIAAYMDPHADRDVEYVTADDFTEAQTRMVMIDAISDHDARGLDRLRSEEGRLEREREQVVLLGERLEQREAEEREAIAAIERTQEQIRLARAELQADIERHIAEHDALSAAQAELQRIINEREEKLRAEAAERARIRDLCDARIRGDVDEAELSEADNEATALCLPPEPEEEPVDAAVLFGDESSTGPQNLAWPIPGPVTSEYGMREGRMHQGIDIAGNNGDPLYSSEAGEVYFAGWIDGYGNTVLIDHGGGVTTLSAHQSVIDVAEGAIVARGQQIGKVGSTGRSSGPHLHFEVKVDGVAVPPRSHLVGR